MRSRLLNKVSQVLVAAVVATLSALGSLSAQSEVTAANDDIEASTRTTQTLLNELRQKERRLYELFNALNSSDNNDIVCSENTASSIQFCEPVFLAELRQQVDVEIAEGATNEAGFLARVGSIFASSEKRAERALQEKAAEPVRLLQQELESLASVHPNLLAQLTTIGDLQKQYLESIDVERRNSKYLMRQNEPSYAQGFGNSNRAVGGKPWFSAPPPGYTQPRIHFGYPDSAHRLRE